MESMDISSLDSKSLREITLQYLTSLQKTDRELKSIAEDLELWNHRQELAKKSNRQDLLDIAVEKIISLSKRSAVLEADKIELESEIARCRKQLHISNDSGRLQGTNLLEQLYNELSEDTEMEAGMRELEQQSKINDDLERLRQQIATDAEGEEVE